MPAESDELDLTEALPELRALHGSRISYQRLWLAVVEGRVPARREGKRWRVRQSDLPAIAAAFGTPPAVAA